MEIIKKDVLIVNESWEEILKSKLKSNLEIHVAERKMNNILREISREFNQLRKDYHHEENKQE